MKMKSDEEAKDSTVRSVRVPAEKDRADEQDADGGRNPYAQPSRREQPGDFQVRSGRNARREGRRERAGAGHLVRAEQRRGLQGAEHGGCRHDRVECKVMELRQQEDRGPEKGEGDAHEENAGKKTSPVHVVPPNLRERCA